MKYEAYLIKANIGINLKKKHNSKHKTLMYMQAQN